MGLPVKTQMGKVIYLHPKFAGSYDTLITLRPWEFRKAERKTNHFIQMSKSHSAMLEYYSKEGPERNVRDIWNPASCFRLEGGVAYTIRAMCTNRANEEKMREIYYLIGLIDCMINQVNPILRTDLLRAVYKKVFSMKKKLNVHMYGPLDQVLLPIDAGFFNKRAYQLSLNSARTVQELYKVIREGTDGMFDVISSEYVFYCPGLGNSNEDSRF